MHAHVHIHAHNVMQITSATRIIQLTIATHYPLSIIIVLIVLGFFTEEETKLRKAFTSVADTLRDNFRFAFSTAKEVMDEYKYSE